LKNWILNKIATRYLNELWWKAYETGYAVGYELGERNKKINVLHVLDEIPADSSNVELLDWIERQI
jgi:hypothetical protein